jgi:hypothetical protein
MHRFIQFLHIFFFLLVSSNSISQEKFFKVFTDNGYDFAEGITQLADSSYLITGSSSSFEEAPAQAFILKIDKQGNHQWSKSYGGSESDWGKRIFHVPNDGIYVMGYSNSFGNTFDFYAFKTDLNGQLLWENHFGGARMEFLHDAIMLTDTSFILVGETTSTLNEVENIQLMRIDKSGELIWEQQLGGEHFDAARAVTLLNDTTFFVAGELYVDEFETQKAMVLRMHIDGTIEWTKTFGVDGKFVLNDIVVTQGRFYGVGYTQPTSTDNLRLFRFISTLDGAPLKVDSENNQGDFRFKCMTPYGTEGKFYLGQQIQGADFATYAEGEDLIVYRYEYFLDWDAANVWASAVGQDEVNEMIPTSDGGAILVGYNTNFSTGGNGAIVMKIGPNDDFPQSHVPPVYSTIVSVQTVEQLSNLKVFPNPFTNELTIQNTLPEPVSYFMYDIMGKLIQGGKIDLNGKINTENLQRGSYLLKIQRGAEICQLKVLKL